MTTKKYEIIFKYIKDLSVEIPNAETFINSREMITKYSLGINITSNSIKNEMIEVITKLNYKDPVDRQKKSYFEIVYAVVVKIDDDVKDKKDLEKIILCEVPDTVYPELEKIFLNLVHDSGFPGLKFEKKVDFNKLFSERSN